ncbi:hypothetical protein [Pontibacter liquoris]|uniref:hypothetical protein n=1 Tax=Pontibacter liquoris TaxID=2905677 RepID=UPI001FA743EA|nr:hypothetical protein [Pontibacter liquoris]
MKKLFLTPLLSAALLLFGCQDSTETINPNVVAQLQGAWLNTAIQQRYYDAAGTLVFESAGSPDSLVYKIKDNNLAIVLDSTQFTNDSTSSQKTLQSMTFVLTDTKDMTRITFTQSGGGTSHTTITAVSPATMTWEDSFENQSYQDSTQTRTAAKVVIRHEFKKLP